MYLDILVKTFRKNKNPSNALAIKKYMRQKFDYLGIKTPERRKILNQFHKDNGHLESEKLSELILNLWQQKEREFQYIAIDILKRRIKKLPAEYMKLYQELITSKSWWDTIDPIAINLAGGHIVNHPNEISKIQKWRYSDDIWLRRTSLLFQLKYKEKTDTKLLFSIINDNLGSQEFFINKAIGWALREYSKTDEAAVRSFVANTELSKLSTREALKWVNR